MSRNKRIPLFQAAVFCLLVILSFSGCRGLLTRREEADRAAINKLHRVDQKASMAQDFETLLSLWTDDGVMLPPDGEAVMGREAIKARMDVWTESAQDIVVLKYEQDFQELEIEGGWAFEWGYYNTTAVITTANDTIRQSGKLMRVLQRQKDDSWKVARSMWQVE